MLFVIIISISTSFIFIFAFSLYEASKHKYFLKSRLTKALTQQDESFAPGSAGKSPLTEVVSKKLDVLINKFIPTNILKEVEKKIITAKMKNFTVSSYFLLKIIIDTFILIFIPLYLAVLNIKLNLGVLSLLLIVGFMFPDMAIDAQIKKRHKQVIKELPGFIDLMRVCVEAGMDLEGSMTKIIEKSSGLLRDEAAIAIGEVKMGKGLAEAIADMVARINHPDLSAFATILLQANKMGISISNVLKTQAHQINLKYVQEVRARTAKVPVLIMIPMVFFIMPTLLLVILGPAIINFIAAFK